MCPLTVQSATDQDGDPGVALAAALAKEKLNHRCDVIGVRPLAPR